MNWLLPFGIYLLTSLPAALVTARIVGKRKGSLGAASPRPAAEGGRPPGAPGQPTSSGCSRQGEQPERGEQG